MHDINIDELIKKYSLNYNVYFVCSERPSKNLAIDPKYKLYRNVISFYYNELNETLDNPLPKIVTNVGRKLYNMLNRTKTIGVNININVQNGIKRVENMNNRCKEIEGQSFDYIDPFYEIHGSHRNRV